jgi:4-amino-4-deoxy-L-arabinose transferase-like glycosyltransferase
MSKSFSDPGKIISPFVAKIRENPGMPLVIPVFIFFLAFIPRIIGLGTGFTTDENVWLIRAPSFINALLRGDFINTYLTYHPGVTTMWLSGIFMNFFLQPGMDFPQYLSVARFPVVLITSIGILLMYFLIKKLFHEYIALLASVLIALDPFYLAHSRFIHVDALVTTFMILSLLAFMVYLRWPMKTFFLIFTGIFLGLALLTKQPAECLIPFFFLVLLLRYLIMVYRDTPDLKKTFYGCFTLESIDGIVKPFFMILFTACVLFIMLWPVMWVAPVDTVHKLEVGLENVVENPHGRDGFFMGQVMTTDHYGFLFYFVVLLMKTTPFTLFFSLFCIIYVIFSLRNPKLSDSNLTIIYFLIFILLFYTLMTIGEKKIERYILPILPVLDILAAVGICACYRCIKGQFDGIRNQLSTGFFLTYKNHFFGMGVILLVIVQSLLIIPIAPYYLSYSNPIILGGPQHSQEYILIGWGEGNDLAAAYLNNKTGAEHLKVYVTYSGFNKYFKGTTTNNSATADYIVFYSSAVQRNFDQDLWNLYKNETPEKVIILNNIEYCWIYPTHLNESRENSKDTL